MTERRSFQTIEIQILKEARFQALWQTVDFLLPLFSPIEQAFKPTYLELCTNSAIVILDQRSEALRRFQFQIPTRVYAHYSLTNYSLKL